MLRESTIKPTSETEKKALQHESFLLGNVVASAFERVYGTESRIDIMTAELRATTWEIIIEKLKEMCEKRAANTLAELFQECTYQTRENNYQGIINTYVELSSYSLSLFPADGNGMAHTKEYDDNTSDEDDSYQHTGNGNLPSFEQEKKHWIDSYGATVVQETDFVPPRPLR